MAEAMTRHGTLAQLRRTYADLDEQLARFDDAKMVKTPVHGDWTVKSILAHLASWEQLEVGWMETVLRREKPFLYAPGFEWDESDWRKRAETIHRFNADVLADSMRRDLDDVMAEFRQTQRHMQEVIGQLPEQALTDPQLFFWIAVEVPRDPWTPMPVNSHEHYIDHTKWLRNGPEDPPATT